MTDPTPRPCEFCETEDAAFLHARCHLTAPLKAELHGHILILRCYIPECAREVARFNVNAFDETRVALEAISTYNQDAIREAAKTGDTLRLLEAMTKAFNGCREVAKAALAAMKGGEA